MAIALLGEEIVSIEVELGILCDLDPGDVAERVALHALGELLRLDAHAAVW
jgi:hypothetical protein